MPPLTLCSGSDPFRVEPSVLDAAWNQCQCILADNALSGSRMAFDELNHTRLLATGVL